MTTLEQVAKEAWERWGGYAKWAFCSKCEQLRYCRSRNRKKWLCLGCHDQS